MPFVPDKISSFVPDRPSSFIPDESQSIAVLDEQLKPIVKKTGEIFFNPLAKTLTGESLHDRAIRATEPSEIKPNDPISYWSAFTKSALGGMAGEVADIATTPFNLIAGPVLGKAGKLISKIPFKGTTVGEIASKVPFKQIFNEDVAAVVSYQNALKNLSQRVSESQSPINIIRNLSNPVAKVTKAIKDAGPIRLAQENLFTAERAKRIERVKSVGSRFPGEAGFFKQLGELKGSLPKIEFQGIRNTVSQSDIDGMYDMITRSSMIDEFEKIAAKNGLTKLFGEVGGRVPTNSEINLLSKIFPQETIKTILDKRPALTRAGEFIADVINIPRSLMTAFDMSAPLRQGVFLIGRPQQWMPAFGNMFKYFFNENSYDDLLNNISKRQNFPLMKRAKLSITNLDRILSNREESFMSNMAEKIPILGKGVRASNRAFSGFLNKLRADTFDDFIKTAQSQGIPLSNKLINDMGTFINSATGRGPLGPALERVSNTLNGLFFSPRLMSSRLTLINPAYYIRLDPMVRKEALRSLFTFSGFAGSIMTLASLSGAEVGNNPRSADFGKIKVGDTRYDVLGGFQQYMRLATQLITGEHISSTTGVKTVVGEGYKPLTRKQILERFIETKEAPLLSFASKMLEGQGFAGQDLDIPKEIAVRFIPMVAQDMYELSKEKGIGGMAMSIPAIFGVGVQTYSSTPREVVISARSAAKEARRLIKIGDEEGGRNLIENNKDLINSASKLSGLYNSLTKIERKKDDVLKTKRLTNEQKRKQVLDFDVKIQEIEDRMETILEESKRQK